MTEQAKQSQASRQDEPAPEAFTVDELKERSRSLVGVSPHAVAGALAGQRRKTHTEDQARKLTNDWLKATVDYGAQR